MSEADTTQDQSTQTDQTTDHDVVNDLVNNDQQTTENEWFLSDGVKGEGDVPEWYKGDKYKSVADQAKAYKDLESKFGSFTGSPEEYEIKLSEELTEKGIEIDKDDPLMTEALEFAKETNMSQDGFEKMVNLYAMSKIAESTVIEEQKAAEIQALGDNAQQRIDNLIAWGNKNLDPEMMEGFQQMATSASAIQTMERMIAMTRGAALNPEGNNSSPTSAEEIQKMQFEKDEFGNRRIHTDKEFGARYKKMRDEYYGTEPYRQQVGG